MRLGSQLHGSLSARSAQNEGADMYATASGSCGSFYFSGGQSARTRQRSPLHAQAGVRSDDLHRDARVSPIADNRHSGKRIFAGNTNAYKTDVGRTVFGSSVDRTDPGLVGCAGWVNRSHLSVGTDPPSYRNAMGNSTQSNHLDAQRNRRRDIYGNMSSADQLIFLHDIDGDETFSHALNPAYEGASGARSSDVRRGEAELWAGSDRRSGLRVGLVRSRSFDPHAYAHSGHYAGAAGASSQEFRAVGRHTSGTDGEAATEGNLADHGLQAAAEAASRNCLSASHISSSGDAMPRRGDRGASDPSRPGMQSGSAILGNEFGAEAGADNLPPASLASACGLPSAAFGSMRAARSGFVDDPAHGVVRHTTLAAAHSRGGLAGTLPADRDESDAAFQRAVASDVSLRGSAGADSRTIDRINAERHLLMNERMERRPTKVVNSHVSEADEVIFHRDIDNSLARESRPETQALFENSAGQFTRHPFRERQVGLRPLRRPASAPLLTHDLTYDDMARLRGGLDRLGGGRSEWGGPETPLAHTGVGARSLIQGNQPAVGVVDSPQNWRFERPDTAASPRAGSASSAIERTLGSGAINWMSADGMHEPVAVARGKAKRSMPPSHLGVDHPANLVLPGGVGSAVRMADRQDTAAYTGAAGKLTSLLTLHSSLPTPN